MTNYSETTSGGIAVGGNTTGSITFEVIKDFPFSVGQCVEYWWQVVGDCVSTTLVTNCPTPGNTSCPRQMLINIMGCSLSEVCDKIAARGYNISIAQIYQYTLPALISQQSGQCGEYVQVYPGTDLPCQSYESVTDPENWGMDFEIEWVGGGGLGFSGDQIVNQIQGSGGFQLFGDGLSSEYFGSFDNEIGIDQELVDMVGVVETTFGNIIFPGGLTTSQDVIANNCNCGVLPVDITLTHNFNDSDRLFNFLTRNGLTLPTTIDLIYSVISYSWQANYHFEGIGEDGISIELWSLVFEWSCTNEVGSMIFDQLWTFGFYANVKNLHTGGKNDTRILLAFDPSEVCSNGLFYGFNLNTATKVVTPISTETSLNVNVDLNTCYDQIGLFTTIDWLENPVLTINIWQSSSPTQQQYLNISTLIPS